MHRELLNSQETMNGFNYIDRQQSATGSSEKSQKVHCANWKEEVHLCQKLEALRRQENATIKRIFSDQKIIANRFRHRVHQSIELIKTHEELKVGLAKKETKGNLAYGQFQTENNRRGLSFMASVDKASNWCSDGKTKSIQLLKRPVTASELRVKAWERKIQTISSKLRRVQSAPVLRKNVQATDHKYIVRLK